MVLLVAGLVALLILFFGFRSRYQYNQLPELPEVGTGGGVNPALPDHVVIIPARNEEKNIGRVVNSFRGSLVVVVDDHSTDRTAELAKVAGAQVREAFPLGKGWLGKPNACWTGVRYSESDWILFADADTWYRPAFLPSAFAYAEQEDLTVITCFPRHEMRTVAERVLLPYAFGLYFTGVDAEAVNHPKSREALANGQCMLVKRDAYEFVQGHRAVSDSVIEDVALARLFKRHLMRIRVMRAESMARVRMYDGFLSIWRGFEKNSFRFLKANPRTGLTVVLASIANTSWLPVFFWLLSEGYVLPAWLFAFVPVIAWAPWYGGPVRACAAPFAIYLFQLIAISGMVKSIFGLKTRWKGRSV
jgi:chlorobactene glucosyltransferase